MPADRRAPLHALGRALVAAFVALPLAAVLASPAGAAVVPQAAASCHGVLTKAPTTDEPNNLRYNVNCSQDITAYTLIVNRTPSDFATVDDFSTTADVFDPTGAVAPGQSFGCEGSIPGSGVNCNGSASAGSHVQGTFDLSDPYCPTIPAGSPPGTNPTQQAMVQLVVTDTTGAESGPFRINADQACPVVKAVPKPKPKTTKHHKKTTVKKKHK